MQYGRLRKITPPTGIRSPNRPDSLNTPSTTNLEEEEIVDAPGNDGNASMPEQVKRPNPRRKMMVMMMMMMITVHLSDLRRAHHQVYIKLYFQPVVQIILTGEQAS